MDKTIETLTNLPNIGLVLANKLIEIGITDQASLEATGSVEAVVQIAEQDLSTCYNMLFALEGAIRGTRWHGIPKEERDLLKQEFDQAR